MNREIKFRVWDSDSHSFRYFNLGDENLRLTYLNVPHFNERIQQFTGLKDRHNKDIYEGDILLDKLTEEAAAEGDGADIGRVFFAAGAFMIDGSGTLYDQTYSHSPDRLVDHEVIGNIFENPELLT